MTGAMVVQERVREATAAGGDGRRAADVAVHEEREVVLVAGERLEHSLAAGDHLHGVVGGDVGREELGLAGLLLGAAHCVGHEAHGLAVRGEDLVTLGLVVLDEVAAQPELVAGVGEEIGPQAELGLDDRAHDHPPVLGRPAEDAPEVGDVAARPVEELQIVGRHVEVMQLGVLDVPHALVVADGEREEGDDHRLAVGDIAVEEFERVGDPHDSVSLVRLVDEGVHRTREVVRGRDLHVGAGRGLGGEVGRCSQVVVTGLRPHPVRAKDVPPASDEFGFAESEIGVAAGLVHFLPPGRAGICTDRSLPATPRSGVPLMCPRRCTPQTSPRAQVVWTLRLRRSRRLRSGTLLQGPRLSRRRRPRRSARGPSSRRPPPPWGHGVGSNVAAIDVVTVRRPAAPLRPMTLLPRRCLPAQGPAHPSLARVPRPLRRPRPSCL